MHKGVMLKPSWTYAIRLSTSLYFRLVCIIMIFLTVVMSVPLGCRSNIYFQIPKIVYAYPHLKLMSEDELLMEAALGLHSFAAQASAALILVHIAAALYSRIKGEGVWSSMVPILKENKPSENEIVRKIAAVEEQFYDKVQSLLIRENK